MTWIRGALGEVLTHLGDLQRGREIQLEVRRLTAARGERRLHCGATNSLAMLELRAGNVDIAIECARSLVDDAHTPASFRSTASALLSRGLVVRGDVEGAMRAAQNAIDMLRTLGADNDDEGLATLAYAEALDAIGDRADAARIIREAAVRLRAAAARISDPELAASFLGRVPNNARVLELERTWVKVLAEPG
jgi:tetratricopeptide (TPR) repeat protein